MRGVRLHVYYIHFSQYIHPIGSNQPLWAAGELLILYEKRQSFSVKQSLLVSSNMSAGSQSLEIPSLIPKHFWAMFYMVQPILLSIMYQVSIN